MPSFERETGSNIEAEDVVDAEAAVVAAVVAAVQNERENRVSVRGCVRWVCRRLKCSVRARKKRKLWVCWGRVQPSEVEVVAVVVAVAVA